MWSRLRYVFLSRAHAKGCEALKHYSLVKMVALIAQSDDFEEKLYSYEGWDTKGVIVACDSCSLAGQSKRRWTYQSPSGPWLLYDLPTNELIDRAYTAGEKSVTLAASERMGFQSNANAPQNNLAPSSLPAHLGSNPSARLSAASQLSQMTANSNAKLTVDFGAGLGQGQGLCQPSVTGPDGRTAAVSYLAIQADKDGKEGRENSGNSKPGTIANSGGTPSLRPEGQALGAEMRERPQMLTQKSLFFAQKILNENTV